MVVSGEVEALDELVGACEAEGVRARRIPVDYASHSAQVEAIREQLLEGCSGIAPRSGEVPFYSTVRGGVLDTAELDAEYWYRNLRNAVEFEQATRALVREGYRTFVEISPHPVLTVGVQETIDQALEGEQGDLDGVQGAERARALDRGEAAVLGSLRRGEGGPARFLRSLGEAWVRGVAVDWDTVFHGSAARAIRLPTYAFQRRRYWLQAAERGVGDLAAAGQRPADHPLLGAAVALAEGGGRLFTGRLSLQTHPWLADHAVLGAVLLPATAFLDLALYAGGQVGCESLAELTLQAPLVLDEREAVQIQLAVGEPDQTGACTVNVYSRPELAAEEDREIGQQAEGAWVCHASGTLAPREPTREQDRLEEQLAVLAAAEWPPRGARRLEIEDVYSDLAELGLEYGPAFQGLQAVWQRGEETFAEVALAEEQRPAAARFGVHPALLDAALHGIGPGLIAGAASAREAGATRMTCVCRSPGTESGSTAPVRSRCASVSPPWARTPYR